MKIQEILTEREVKIGDKVTYTDGGIELKVLKIDDLGVHKLEDLENGSIHHVPEDEFNSKYKLTEGEGIDKMRFSVTFMFNTEQTGKMDPHRIEMELQDMLEGIFGGDDSDANDYAVDDIVVRREG